MAKLIIIAAIGKNGELGKNNDLIWHLKEDLKFFKETTLNHKIVMGYNTYKSLPKTLPNREYVVLTHRELNIPGVKIFNDFNNLIEYLNTLDEDIYIIGGASIYKLFLPYINTMLLTEIDRIEENADVYFPIFNKEEFERDIIKEVEEDKITYKHVRYRRR